jgi:hypothetical protein
VSFLKKRFEQRFPEGEGLSVTSQWLSQSVDYSVAKFGTTLDGIAASQHVFDQIVNAAMISLVCGELCCDTLPETMYLDKRYLQRARGFFISHVEALIVVSTVKYLFVFHSKLPSVPAGVAAKIHEISLEYCERGVDIFSLLDAVLVEMRQHFTDAHIKILEECFRSNLVTTSRVYLAALHTITETWYKSFSVVAGGSIVVPSYMEFIVSTIQKQSAVTARVAKVNYAVHCVYYDRIITEKMKQLCDIHN